MSTYAFIVHILRHHFCGTLNLIIRATMECMRSFSPYPAIKLHSNDFVTRIFRYINIRHPHIYRRLQPCQSLSYLLLSFIGYLLSDDLQRTRGNAENQPTTFRVKESTCRMHTVFQLAGSFLQFQSPRLIRRYQFLYIVYCHNHNSKSYWQ